MGIYTDCGGFRLKFLTDLLTVGSGCLNGLKGLRA